MTSETTLRARAFVDQHLDQARGLGTALAELINDPEEFAHVLRQGLSQLADPVYAAEQERVAPGSGAVFGVRIPLLSAVARQLRAGLRGSSAASALSLAQRLAREEQRESRLLGLEGIRRSLPDDPERSWQLLRQHGRAASEWISVDTLADLYARGILLEPFRWAELEQLIYSPHRWERRLVGSTLATLPHRVPRGRRAELRESPGLTLIKSLIGDDEPDVQKALSWALRSWYSVDPNGVRAFLSQEAQEAARTADGHRAWVLRDALTLPAHEPAFVAEIRDLLAGIRRRAGAPPTSPASQVAAAFRGDGALDDLGDKAISMQGERQRLAVSGTGR